MKPFKAIPASKKLNDSDLASIEEAQYHLRIEKMKIVNRAYYIYKTIAKAIGAKADKVWKLDDSLIDRIEAQEVDASDYFYTDFDDIFEDAGLFDGVPSENSTMLVRSGHGEEIHTLSHGDFPTRWLYEDFEDELHSGLKKYRDKLKKELEEEQQEKHRRKKLKENRNKIIASVKKKLSPEEIEVVFG